MPRMSRRARRTMREFNQGVDDVKGFVEQNPVTSAFLGLAAGALATGVYKHMTAEEPPAPARAKKPAAGKTAPKRARRAK